MSASSSVCAKCNKAISSGTVLTALEKSWHPGCFVCNVCRASLQKDAEFTVKDDKPVCLACHSKRVPECAECRKKMDAFESYVTYDNKCYHGKCFACRKCKQSLSDKEFAMRDGQRLCKDCLTK